MDASQDTTSEAMSKGDRAAVVREMARLTIEHFRDVWRKEQKKRDDAKLKAGKWYCVNSDDFGAENCLHAALEVDRVWLKNNWGTIIKSINVLIPLDHGVSVVTHGRFERKLWGGGTLTTQYRFVWFSERFFRADLSAAGPGAIGAPSRRSSRSTPSPAATDNIKPPTTPAEDYFDIFGDVQNAPVKGKGAGRKSRKIDFAQQEQQAVQAVARRRREMEERQQQQEQQQHQRQHQRQEEEEEEEDEEKVEGNHVHAPPRHQPMAHPFHPPAPPPPFGHGLPPQPPAFAQGLPPRPHVLPPPLPFPLPPHMYAQGHQHLPPPFYPPPPPPNISVYFHKW